MNSPKVCLSLVADRDGQVHYFDLCGYIKDAAGKIRRVRVETAGKSVSR